MKFYGGARPVTVIGRDHFAGHDPSTTWDDGGVSVELAAGAVRDAEDAIASAIKTIQSRLDDDLKAYGAHQVRDAVVDYVSNAYLDIAVVNGKLCACFDASNDKSQLRACFDLAELLYRVANEASSDQIMIDKLSDLQSLLPSPAKAMRFEQLIRSPQEPIGKAAPRKGVVRSDRRPSAP